MASTASRDPGATGASARILVADDEPVTRDMVQRALQIDGHDITIVEDGAAALSALENAPAFDIVITDIDMPNINGLEVVERLLTNNAAQRIIIMSGIADELTRARALLSPTVRMITKPVSLERIRGEVTELLA